MTKITIDDALCLRPAEAAKALRIGKTAFYKLVRTGQIQVNKLSTRCTLVPMSELQRLASKGVAR